MRFRAALLGLISIVPTIASADVLTDLRATLARLTATTPIHGTLDVTSTTHSDEDNNVTQGRAGVGFEASDAGLRIHYPRTTLVQATTETRARAQDPERAAPVRSGLRQIAPLELADLLDAAPALSILLESAQLVETKASPYRGKPARLAVFKVAPKMSKKQAKHMKKLDVKLSVWLGDDGVPLGAEQALDAKASFLLMSFQSTRKEAWTFAHVGDRLVAVRQEENEKSDGFGEHSVENITRVITLQ